MAYHERQYDLYVVLGNPEVSPVWAEPTWSQIASAIDPLIQMARAPAAVRTTQLRPGVGSPNQRAISFGRIGWNRKGHEKWVRRFPDEGADEKPNEFISAEIWAPSWTVCTKQNVPPDIYLAIRNEKTWSKDVQFNPLILLAVARDHDVITVEQGKASANNVAETVSSVLRVHCERPWARLFRTGPLTTDAISDLLFTGLFKIGPIHDRRISSEVLKGAWEIF
jgi:hypothetical protein